MIINFLQPVLDRWTFQTGTKIEKWKLFTIILNN